MIVEIPAGLRRTLCFGVLRDPRPSPAHPGRRTLSHSPDTRARLARRPAPEGNVMACGFSEIDHEIRRLIPNMHGWGTLDKAMRVASIVHKICFSTARNPRLSGVTVSGIQIPGKRRTNMPADVGNAICP